MHVIIDMELHLLRGFQFFPLLLEEIVELLRTIHCATQPSLLSDAQLQFIKLEMRFIDQLIEFLQCKVYKLKNGENNVIFAVCTIDETFC